MVSSLFRPEVIEAETNQWLGAVRLAQPISIWLIVTIAILLATGLISFISFGNVTRKAHVAGITVPVAGSLTIAAPTSATLKNSPVKEGQKVTKGQVLFELSTEHMGSKGELSVLVGTQLSIRQQTLDAERRTRSDQYKEKKKSLSDRQNGLIAEGVQLEQEIKLAEYRERLAVASVDKFKVLEKSGFVSFSQLQQKEEELIDVRSKLVSLKRAKAQLETGLIGLRSEARDLEGSHTSEMAQLDISAATLRQEIAENEGRKTLFIISPQAGMVSTITYASGQSVNAGQIIATLIPDSGDTRTSSEMEAHLFVPSRSVGFIEVGQQVNIRYDAFSFEKFGLQKGTVKAVSMTPFAPSELPVNLASTVLGTVQRAQGNTGSEGLYRVKIELERQSISVYGREQKLKPGMTLEADIAQDHRKIWEWFIDPILASWKR